AASLRGDAKAAGRLLGAATALREGTVGTVMGQGTAIRETIIGRLLAAERADTGLAAPRVGDRSAFAAADTDGLRDPRAPRAPPRLRRRVPRGPARPAARARRRPPLPGRACPLARQRAASEPGASLRPSGHDSSPQALRKEHLAA